MLYDKEVIKTHFEYCDLFIQKQKIKFNHGEFKDHSKESFLCFCLQYVEEKYLNPLKEQHSLSEKEVNEIYNYLSDLYILNDENTYYKFYDKEEALDKKIEFLSLI